MQPVSVQSLCNTLVRVKLFPTDEVRSLFLRWQKGARSPDDAEQFVKWLVANRQLTDFQASLLLKGHTDRLFLGDYKLIDRIGRGRMAGIYKAEHRLGQTVAIKILPPSKVKDPQAFGRFQREARLAVKLKHPNIVRTFQAGEANGLHYIVMEYLDGETLEDVLKRRGRLPSAEAVRLIHQALLGLQHLYDRDMVHRDFKPANLMLVPGPIPGRLDNTLHSTVKILDIGLGRAMFDEGDPDSGEPNEDLTAAGDIVGTPDYMAPEQARDAHGADVRADIYALGCVLYHALTGQVPFPDNNMVRKMIKHATEPPKPLRTFVPDIPEGLQQILDWMMAKDPAQRYPTPDRAAQALQVFLVASAEPTRSPEGDPEMRSYLDWLKAQQPAEESPRRAAALPIPVAPAAAVAVPVTADVELVAVPAPVRTSGRGETGWQLSRRDLILLGVGGGAVILAIVLGVLLSRGFSPKPALTPPEATEPLLR